MEYKIGDMVIIHKPSNIQESPKWVQEMNIWDGKTGVITSITDMDSRNLTFVHIKGTAWKFNISWLEPYEDEFELEDLECLM